MERREAAKLAMEMDLSKPTQRRIVDLVDTKPETYVLVEPLEDLVVTHWEEDEQFDKMKMHTVFTRRKGLHWLRSVYKYPDGEEDKVPWTLVVESMTAASGPKYGCFIGMEEYRDVVVTEEERRANRENINRIVNQVMVRMGIW